MVRVNIMLLSKNIVKGMNKNIHINIFTITSNGNVMQNTRRIIKEKIKEYLISSSLLIVLIFFLAFNFSLISPIPKLSSVTTNDIINEIKEKDLNIPKIRKIPNNMQETMPPRKAIVNIHSNADNCPVISA